MNCYSHHDIIQLVLFVQNIVGKQMGDKEGGGVMSKKPELRKDEGFLIEDGILEKYTGEETKVVIPDGVKAIGSFVFTERQNITSVTIPKSVTSIGDYAFDCCYELISITIPDSVTKIGKGAFFRCSSLESIRIPDGIKRIERSTFEGCKNLKNVELPESLTSIGDEAFAACRNLTTVEIPKGVKKISYCAFVGCFNLQDISTPKGPIIIEPSTLQGIGIENGILKKYYGVGTELVIPEGVTEIGQHTFSRINDLTSITIPRSVKKIGHHAFTGCTKLKSITVPSSVTVIEEKAFPEDAEVIIEEKKKRKYKKAFLCTDNRKLRMINSDISISWETKYIGRKIIADEYNKLFDHNGYYYETEQYFMNDITANINPTIDEDGYILDIDSYKVKDNSSGHGRPRTVDREFSKRDINHFSKIMDSVTEDFALNQYEKLIASLDKDEMLPGGFSIDNITPEGVFMVSLEGENKLLTKKSLLESIDISKVYIDILYDIDTMTEMPELFDENDIPFYAAVFSKLNCSSFHNCEQLKKDAKERKLLRDAEDGYQALIKAVKDENVDEIHSLIEFAPIVIGSQEGWVEPPIIIAAKKNNSEIVKELLEGGAFSKERYLDEDKALVSPLHLAIKNKNYDLIKLLCQYGGVEEDNYFSEVYRIWGKDSWVKVVFESIGEMMDLEALKTIIPFLVKTQGQVALDASVFPDLSDDDIALLMSIAEIKICWPVSIIEKVYKQDKMKCRDMILQGCEEDAIDYFIEVEDFELFELILSEHKDISHRASFNKIYACGGKWYDSLIRHGVGYVIGNRDIYLCRLIEDGKFKEFESSVENMGIQISDSVLSAFRSFNPEGKPLSLEEEEFLLFVLEHYKYNERSDYQKPFEHQFRDFTAALIMYAPIDTVQKYLNMFQKRIFHDVIDFCTDLGYLINYRSDLLYEEFLNNKFEYDETRDSNDKQLKLSGFDSYRQETAFKVFGELLSGYTIAREYEERASKAGDSLKVSEERNRASRWMRALNQFLSIVPVMELDSIFESYPKMPHVNSALELAKVRRIQYEEVLSLFC